MADINGVEIFRAGTWNGDTFTISDLDDMVAAFDKAGFRPTVKVGHAEKSGDPAFGFVNRIRRLGDRLVADLVDIPDKLFAAIKDRRFDSVSSEIFFNLKRGGQTFRRALKAVAILGAEIPAVSDLEPLRNVVLQSDAICRTYSFNRGGKPMKDYSFDHEPMTSHQAGAELMALAADFMKRTGEKDEFVAFEIAARAHPPLANAYSGIAPAPREKSLYDAYYGSDYCDALSDAKQLAHERQFSEGETFDIAFMQAHGKVFTGKE